ncbi:MAG: bacillithiol system redox-active protein YtxJ [Bacteroidetes bacterium]|nr:bacillithiol system redox-active protein YtxJ [Bacteroidota bacterium]
MSIFSFLSGSNEADEAAKFHWNALEDLATLDAIIQESAEYPVVIFKHSTRCGVSKMALRQFEKEYPKNHQDHLYLLDLLEHRDVSNAIAEKLGVVHQSPQVLVLRGGQSVYDASHSLIDAATTQRILHTR